MPFFLTMTLHTEPFNISESSEYAMQCAWPHYRAMHRLRQCSICQSWISACYSKYGQYLSFARDHICVIKACLNSYHTLPKP